MRKIKKIISMLLCSCMLFGLMGISAAAKRENIIAEGTCGTATLLNGNIAANVWQLTNRGVLTITGVYNSRKNPIPMPAYSADGSNLAPWAEYRAQIKAVVIEGVLPNIGEGAFANCTSLQSVLIGDSVEIIGTDAFYGCRALQSVSIPETVGGIAGDAFAFCFQLEEVTIWGKDTSLTGLPFSDCSDYLTIRCLPGSIAQSFAERNGINIELILVPELFSDVPENAWYVDSVQYVFDEELMSGNDGLFNPTKNVTRAQLVTTLYRLAGSPEVTDYSACGQFTDILTDKYYTDAVCWAINVGVATGNPETMMFDTTGNLSRQQLAAFLYRYSELMGHGTNVRGDISTMLNADKVSLYAKDAVEWAVGVGLLSGSLMGTDDAGNEIRDLNPRGNTTRAQLAVILQRYCESDTIY